MGPPNVHNSLVQNSQNATQNNQNTQIHVHESTHDSDYVIKCSKEIEETMPYGYMLIDMMNPGRARKREILEKCIEAELKLTHRNK